MVYVGRGGAGYHSGSLQFPETVPEKIVSKKSWGLIVPLVVAGLTFVGVGVVSPRSSIGQGIYCGMVIALVQSYLSTLALLWSWNKQFFYWVWGGGVLFRMIVFAATAFVVYRYTSLSLVATLVTMVSATTLFLVVESATFFSKPT